MNRELLEKYTGLALQGIMANPTSDHKFKEWIAARALEVAEATVLNVEKYYPNPLASQFCIRDKEIPVKLKSVASTADMRSILPVATGEEIFLDAVLLTWNPVDNILSVRFSDGDDLRLAVKGSLVDLSEDLGEKRRIGIINVNERWVIDSVEHIPEDTVKVEHSDSDDIFTIRNGDAPIPIDYNGKVICFVGNIANVRKRSISVELDDKVGTLIDISLGESPAPQLSPSFELKNIYATVHYDAINASLWFTLNSVEDYIPISPGQLTVAEAISLIEQGKVSDVIGREEEEVFSNNRDQEGDHRAAWRAFEHHFLKYGMSGPDVIDQVSSRQVDSVSQLITNYLFAKYE